MLGGTCDQGYVAANPSTRAFITANPGGEGTAGTPIRHRICMAATLRTARSQHLGMP